LKYCQERGELSDLKYGLIDNATDDVEIVSYAGNKITNLCHISPENRLKGQQQATINNYRQLAQKVQIIHSIHHASARFDNPTQTALLLADGKLTIGELLTPAWRLPNLSDIFLACCETGLGIPEKLTDDLFTLSAAFLCAGARNVISTLWSVDAISTTIFCINYYELHQTMSRVEALQIAQHKLRSFTGKELQPITLQLLEEFTGIKLDTYDRDEINNQLKQLNNQIKKDEYNLKQQVRKFPNSPEVEQWEATRKEKQILSIKLSDFEDLFTRYLAKKCDQELPFDHPYYWSGFTCQGLR
jgi:CHAT domain-containing protein